MEKLTSEGSVTELDWFVFICVCVCVGSHRVYGWRGAHQSGGANGGGGTGSGPDTRDHQGPGEYKHAHTQRNHQQ